MHPKQAQTRSELEREDRANSVTVEANNLKQFAGMASSIFKCLKFTHDSPEAYEAERMPVLDTEMWLGIEQMQPGIL